MPKNVCLMVLIGLPAAGKTTFCRWLDKTPQIHFNIIHICYDDFLEFHQLPSHGPSKLNFFYKTQRIEIFKMIETVANALKNSKDIPPHILQKIQISDKHVSTRDYIILCDDNFFLSSMRYKIYQLCKSQSYAYAQIYFECDKQTALNHNARREFKSRLPENVITQMAARLEVPITSKAWETPTLNLYTTKLNFSIDSVLLLAFKAFENISEIQTAIESTNPIANKQEEASLIHKLDIKLRRHINELLKKEHSKNIKHSKALQLNANRKKILQQCRELTLDEAHFDTYVNLLSKNLK